MFCDFQMVKLLLEKGATINAFDKKDRRAIHWAAFMGHVDVIKTLVSYGAELNCRDKQVGDCYNFFALHNFWFRRNLTSIFNSCVEP